MTPQPAAADAVTFAAVDGAQWTAADIKAMAWRLGAMNMDDAATVEFRTPLPPGNRRAVEITVTPPGVTDPITEGNEHHGESQDD